MLVLRIALICFLSHFHFSFSQSDSGKALGRNRDKYQFGVKIIGERSGYPAMTPGYFPVLNGGLQLIKKLGGKYHFFETGVYYVTAAIGEDLLPPPHNWLLLYRNINIPLNYRIKKEYFYFSGGLMVNFLIGVDEPGAYGSFKALEKNTFGFNLAGGAEVKLNQKLNIFLEGRYSRTVFSYYSSFGDGFCNYGLATGINYKFAVKIK
jgi:hypothetical protein